MPFHLKLATLLAFACFHVFMQAQESVVRPCTHEDWKTATSTEAKTAIGKGPNSFEICESLALPWASDAFIIRLHTPIKTDYSETVTLIRNKRNSTLRAIHSGEGLIIFADPNKNENKQILNDLIASAHRPQSADDLAEVSDVYAFMLDIESGKSFFPRLEKEHALQKSASVCSTEEQPSSVVISIPTRRGLCSLHFTKSGGFQLSKAICQQA